ncbi:hypothetical protein SAMN04490247_1435 [Salimicrobium halophilum]|uniref:Uncharacterized protein n=1 Tax=Salimicrobium halophilum TaxID=86666 RepID=A0A1G8SFS3_9BACI|nr:hypothetical protein SAMN04490247_1435 [Salimicrobium halophilum]
MWDAFGRRSGYGMLLECPANPVATHSHPGSTGERRGRKEVGHSGQKLKRECRANMARIKDQSMIYLDAVQKRDSFLSVQHMRLPPTHTLKQRLNGSVLKKERHSCQQLRRKRRAKSEIMDSSSYSCFFKVLREDTLNSFFGYFPFTPFMN